MPKGLSSLILLTFIVTLGLLSWWGLKFSYELSGPSEKSRQRVVEQLHQLTTVDYYLLRQTHPFVHLNASRLQYGVQAALVAFTHPDGELYDSSGDSVSYLAQRGELDLRASRLMLNESVKVYQEDSEILSQSTLYDFEQDFFYAVGDVRSHKFVFKEGDVRPDKVFVDAREMKSWPARKEVHYEGAVRGRVERARTYEPTIFFQTDQMKIYWANNFLEMLGHVNIKRREVDAKAFRGEIFLDNYNKKLKYYALYDDVQLVEKMKTPEGREVIRRAFSEKLEGISGEEKIVMTGYPKVLQDEDIIKGNRITFYENNETIIVDDTNSSFRLEKSEKK